MTLNTKTHMVECDIKECNSAISPFSGDGSWHWIKMKYDVCDKCYKEYYSVYGIAWIDFLKLKEKY